MDINIKDLLEYARQPAVPESRPGEIPFAFVPDGYKKQDIEDILANPVRKRASVVLNDTDSFCAYINKHSHGENTVLYADADLEKQTVKIIGLLDDHGSHQANWRDHTATYAPRKTVEWCVWNQYNRKPMSQLEFATFIEDNLADIATVEGMPTGTEMLGMALQFEANAEKTFKSKLNIQGGGINLQFVDDDDSSTKATMKVFERFTLGISVFINNTPDTEGEEPVKRIVYPLVARLKYRQNHDKLTFWYELVRPDRVFAEAVKDETKKIKDSTDMLLIAGNPGPTDNK